MSDVRTNLRVPRPTRKKPQPGDVFAMQLPDETYIFGRLILAEIPEGRAPMPGAYLIYVYSERSELKQPDLAALDPDRLLLPPVIINRMPWTKEPCGDWGLSSYHWLDDQVSDALGIPRAGRLTVRQTSSSARRQTLTQGATQPLVGPIPRELDGHLSALTPRWTCARGMLVRMASNEPIDPGIVGANLVDPGRRESPYPELAGSACAYQWICNPRAVVSTGPRVWGDFASHRPYILPNLVAESQTATDLRDFLTRRLYGVEPLDLRMVPGPAGPIFQVETNGTHRCHLARLLDFPAERHGHASRRQVFKIDYFRGYRRIDPRQ